MSEMNNKNLNQYKNPDKDLAGEIKVAANKNNKKNNKKKNKEDKKFDMFNKNFNAILAIAIILILAIAYFLFISPLISDYQSLSDTVLNEKRQELKDRQKIYDELTALNENYNSINNSLKDKVKDALPDLPDLPDFYYNLEQIAQQTGYEILALTVRLPDEIDEDKKSTQKVNNLKKIKRVDFDVTLQGMGYLGFKKFFDLVEHNLRMTDVMSLSYRSKEKTSELELSIYYYN